MPNSGNGSADRVHCSPCLCESGAARAALRLPDLLRLKEGNLKGHVRILEIFWDTPSLAVSERMSKKLSFSRNFRVVISDRSSWRIENAGIKQGSQLWYTDGSKLEDGSAGAGVVGPNYQRAIAMGKTATVFQAEVHAIELCARECLRRSVSRADICILSDSQAALKALTSYTFQSRLVWECYELLQAISLRNRLVLIWIPGHEGHEGNERADCLAKRGAARSFIGPEPFCGVNNSFKDNVLRRWEEESLVDYWRALKGMRQAKRLMNPRDVRPERVVNLSRKDIRLYTGLMTGHCKLNYHLKKLKLVSSDSCRLCNEAKETAEHILCECPAACRRRITYLGAGLLDPKDLGKIKPTVITRFADSLGLGL